MDVETLPSIIRLLLALIFVITLMGGLAFALKRLGLSGMPPVKKAAKKHRLSLVESLPLDARRRAVLLRRDDTEHLVILSATGETVVETAITGTKPTKKPAKKPRKKVAKKK